ncbi:MAG TPA: hypothetical protein VGN12_29845 [Pirellulales bacterium]|jgi:hypothetical protein
MAKKSINRTCKNIPVTSMFGPPPLFEGEDEKAYSALLKQIRDAVKPIDVIDEMSVRDCADLFWETLRLRRHKAELINANMYKGLRPVLETVCSVVDVHRLMAASPMQKPGTLKHIEGLLKAEKLSMETVRAQTLVEIIDKIERIDQMIMASESRRHVTLRELDRRRSMLAQALREATKEIEDAEFVELESPPKIESEATQLETSEAADEDEPKEGYPNSEAAE